MLAGFDSRRLHFVLLAGGSLACCEQSSIRLGVPSTASPWSVHMTHFLIVYRRSSGTVLERRDFTDAERDQALAMRSKRELEFRTDPDVEVIVLSAESFDALMRTHSRYFRTQRQLFFDQLREAVRSSPLMARLRRGY